ncbi:MAG: ABC transporter permease, partial [Clostridia bacterium]|nr:ABC transporter permease [Clostridia bacterium]
DATMEQLYAYMTQQILANPDFADQLVVNSRESFLGFFSIMPSEYRAELLSAMINAAKQKDPTGYSLKPIMAVLSQTTGGVTVTADNLVKLLPVLSTEQIMLALVGMPATDATETMPAIPAIPGLIELCGEDVMQIIYTEMTARIKTLTITEESFTLLLQGGFIPDDQFVAMEEMLYNLAPQTDATYDRVLEELGDAEKATPASIHFYAVDFESKDRIEEFISNYNEGAAEEDRLQYTDVIGLMMSSVTIIINAITYVLIAFVAISLVVSSIMIGIITYISVLERTKEIGILRAIGASKRDVSRVFNAETIIVGFVAGMIGILGTLFFNVIINVILFHFTQIANLKAALPVGGAIILVLISMLLTFIAGLFPSGIAAKRNPVEALAANKQTDKQKTNTSPPGSRSGRACFVHVQLLGVVCAVVVLVAVLIVILVAVLVVVLIIALIVILVAVLVLSLALCRGVVLLLVLPGEEIGISVHPFAPRFLRNFIIRWE